MRTIATLALLATITAPALAAPAFNPTSYEAAVAAAEAAVAQECKAAGYTILDQCIRARHEARRR